MFIDTHTHYYDEVYRQDADLAIDRAVQAGVGKMLEADVDSTERPGMFEVCDRHPGVLFPMLGIFPGSIKDDWKDELEKMLQYSNRKVYAIGEVGLDYHENKDFSHQQQDALHELFAVASRMDLPLNIHLREATDDFFKVMDDCRSLHLRGNLHCFSGSIETFQRIRRYGEWYVGIGGVVTFKHASIAETIKQIPLECILLETDCPYLAPAPMRGTRNESANIPVIAAKIAEQKGISIEEVASVTTANAEKLFGI